MRFGIPRPGEAHAADGDHTADVRGQPRHRPAASTRTRSCLPIAATRS